MTRQRRHSFVAGTRRLLGFPVRLSYCLYAAVLFVALASCALVATVLLPRLAWRRAAARLIARGFLELAGMPLRVRSLDQLPDGQCVVVSNHASYLDGVVFTAALPPRFGFVIKREMAAVPLAGLLLRRLGSEFVERFNRHRGAADARRVLRTAAGGSSLAFFPEGTFTRTPGLLKFHSGAFMTAARARCPVVPAVVRGTRRALPPTRGWPRPGRIVVDILPAITPPSLSPEKAAVDLRERARAQILLALGEPDLSATCSADIDRRPGTERARSVRASSTSHTP